MAVGRTRKNAPPRWAVHAGEQPRGCDCAGGLEPFVAMASPERPESRPCERDNGTRRRGGRYEAQRAVGARKPACVPGECVHLVGSGAFRSAFEAVSELPGTAASPVYLGVEKDGRPSNLAPKGGVVLRSLCRWTRKAPVDGVAC